MVGREGRREGRKGEGGTLLGQSRHFMQRRSEKNKRRCSRCRTIIRLISDGK